MTPGLMRRIAEAMLLLAIVVAPWPYGGAAEAVGYALSAWVCAALCLWSFARAASGLGAPALTASALGLAGLAVVQSLLGRSAAPAWTLEAALLLAAAGGVLLFWSEEARDRAAAPRLATAALVACAAQAVFGAVQWSIAPDRIYGHFSTMPFASFMTHNHFAGLVGMGVVLAAGMAVGHARRGGGLTPGAVGLAGLSLGLAAAHLASRSRGGVIALLGGLAALALLGSRITGRRRTSILWMAVLAVLVLAFGLVAIPDAARERLATLLRGPSDPSGALRVQLAAATLRLAAARPLLGWGLGAYADALPAFKRSMGELRPAHAESDVLEVLAEAGLAGLLVMAWLSRRLWAGFRDRVTEGRDPFRKGLATGALAAGVTLAVHSLFDFNLRIPSNALVFVSLLGLAGSPRTEPAALDGRRASLALALLFAVLAVAGAWRSAGASALSAALEIRDPNQRLAVLDGVVAAHPYLVEARSVRGHVWRDLAWQPPRWVVPRLARAEADFRAALRGRPRAASLWADLGWVRYFQGDVEEARVALRRAAELDPTSLDLSLAYADFLARTGDLRAALGEARRERGRHPFWTLDRVALFATRWTRDPAWLALLTDGSDNERLIVAQIAASAMRN